MIQIHPRASLALKFENIIVLRWNVYVSGPNNGAIIAGGCRRGGTPGKIDGDIVPFGDQLLEDYTVRVDGVEVASIGVDRIIKAVGTFLHT